MSDNPVTNSLATRAQERAANLATIERSIIVTDAGGNTSITITDELRSKFNVLAPSGVFMQENPSIKPMLAIVQLNDEDYYDIDKTHKAPDKNGLSKIRDARGISFPSALNHGDFGIREQFTVEYEGRSRTLGFRTYKYTAVGVMRDADGSLKEFPAEIDFDPQVALLEAELDVKRRTKNWGKKPTDSEMFDLILERFKELVKYAAPMVKSKAQNAAIRTAAKVPQKFLTVDSRKPFLLVNYVFQSDSNEARTALMQSVFGVSSPAAMLYGKDEYPSAATSVDEEIPQADEDDASDFDVVDGEFTVDEGREVNKETGEFTEIEYVEPEPKPEVTTEVCAPDTTIQKATPEPAEEKGASASERQAFGDLMGYTLKFTDQKGQTLRQVFDNKAEGMGMAWLKAASDFYATDHHKFQNPDTLSEFENIAEFYRIALKAGL